MKRGKRPDGWPKQVRLRNRNWPIHYVTSSHPELDEEEDEHSLGVCNVKKHAIWLAADEDSGLEQLKDTLVHELAHAYFCQAHLPEELEKHEEAIVRFATSYFFELVRGCEAFWDEE